jgi:hypothetical protein
VDTPYPKIEDADRMVATTAGLRENSNESSGAVEGAKLHDKLDTSGSHSPPDEETSLSG